MIESSAENISLNTRQNCFSKKLKGRHRKTIWIITFFFLLLISSPTKAQETGPLLMKQELGYTLGGGVFGSGLGVVVWFMDPLNPGVTLKSTVTNGFVAGTALGALFGFYMMQNAIILPRDNKLPDNLDQLLGVDDLSRPINRSIFHRVENMSERVIKIPIFRFRF